MRADLPEETDLLVFGGGVGGMAAALVTAHHGLRAVLCEKTRQLGGTTATSGGSAWIVGSTQARRAGIQDTLESGRAYLNDAVGRYSDEAVREAFLQSGAEAIDFLEAHTEVKFSVPAYHPDYYADKACATRGGRNLAPLPFDGRLLGEDFRLVRPPRDEFLALGGMAVGRDEIQHLVRPWASLSSLRVSTRLVLRHARDRIRYPRGTRLLMGNALIARLLVSLRQRSVPVYTEAKIVDLKVEDGRVVGAEIRHNGARRVIRATRGVVLATGGFASSEMRRREYLGPRYTPYAVTFSGAEGEGIEVACAVGGGIAGAAASPGMWMPASVLKRPGQEEVVFPHLRDRAKPGVVAVNSAGRRFVNEANSYHDVVTAMFEEHKTVPCIPAYLVCDRSFIRDFGLGLVRPLWSRLRPFVEAGYLVEGSTLEELAGRMGIDSSGLAATIAQYNRDAISGVDTLFGRGDSELNKLNGAPGPHPNPCMRPIENPPFYALAVYPSLLATSLGLATDADAQVLDANGSPIGGLYAVGNDMASVFGGIYPGPGATIGPALTFAYRAARHAAGSRSALGRPDRYVSDGAEQPT